MSANTLAAPRAVRSPFALIAVLFANLIAFVNTIEARQDDIEPFGL